jgi:hypothetical protein
MVRTTFFGSDLSELEPDTGLVVQSANLPSLKLMRSRKRGGEVLAESNSSSRIIGLCQIINTEGVRFNQIKPEG